MKNETGTGYHPFLPSFHRCTCESDLMDTDTHERTMLHYMTTIMPRTAREARFPVTHPDLLAARIFLIFFVSTVDLQRWWLHVRARSTHTGAIAAGSIFRPST